MRLVITGSILDRDNKQPIARTKLAGPLRTKRTIGGVSVEVWQHYMTHIPPGMCTRLYLKYYLKLWRTSTCYTAYGLVRKSTRDSHNQFRLGYLTYILKQECRGEDICN